jgi:hypothetical protein
MPNAHEIIAENRRQQEAQSAEWRRLVSESRYVLLRVSARRWQVAERLSDGLRHVRRHKNDSAGRYYVMQELRLVGDPLPFAVAERVLAHYLAGTPCEMPEDYKP